MSSPSILDVTALTAALSVFAGTDMKTIVCKSQSLTTYLESLLNRLENEKLSPGKMGKLWTIITPKDKTQRGAMLSLRWHCSSMLQSVTERLKIVGVIVDLKRPDIMRVSPTALYNTHEDVWVFVQKLKDALELEG